MNVQELIERLKKLPKDMEVRYAVPKGKGHTLYAINTVENQTYWAILKFQDR